jgi:hypothetical protein
LAGWPSEDGIADTRKVFTDQVQMLTSVEVGRGGVWLMCPPQLLFIPDNQAKMPTSLVANLINLGHRQELTVVKIKEIKA